MRYVADMYAAACSSGHVDDILSSYILGPYIVRIEEFADLFLIAESLLGFSFFFTLEYLSELFSVEAADSSVRLEDLKSFTDVTEIDRWEERAIRASEALESGNTRFVQIHKIGHVVLYGIR